MDTNSIRSIVSTEYAPNTLFTMPSNPAMVAGSSGQVLKLLQPRLNHMGEAIIKANKLNVMSLVLVQDPGVVGRLVGSEGVGHKKVKVRFGFIA